MTSQNRNHTILMIATVTMALFAGTANAQLTTQLGILDLAANGGINPATGAPWADGDTYRFIFASSTGRDATSTNIADYNTFVQGLANASPLGLSSVTWNAMASTETVAARDNTNTNAGVDGPGESFFLVDGSTLVADDYADLYGSNTHSNVINQSETGGAPFDGGDFTSVWTGSDGSGQPKVSGGGFGGNNWLGAADGDSLTGLWNFTSGAHWIERFNINNTLVKGLYGVSEVLEVSGPPAAATPEPQAFALALFGLFGLMGFRRRRRR